MTHPAPLADAALDQLFRSARTHNRFLPEPVPEALLRDLYALYRWGPTSMNCQPGRVVFVASAEAKARLKPALSAGNVDKTMAAPVTAIVAHDTRFFEHLPTQFPSGGVAARERLAANPAGALDMALKNGTLQGAYLMLAARALGLACGPMGGFHAKAVDAAFFPDGRWASNFLVNLGYGDPAGVHPRGPRLDFDEVARIV